MKSFGIVFLSCLVLIACSDKSSGPASDIDAKVEELLGRMTLEEKIGQMNQYNGFWDVTGPVPAEGDAKKKYEHLRKGLVGSMINVRGTAQVRAVQKIAVEETRLGIPLIIGFDLIHGYETVVPIPLGMAASWDTEAIERTAKMSAAEAAASGINWTFSPMVDISRDPRWGRVMEGAGEDPYLCSRVAEAFVRGYQGEDLSLPNTIAATAKHFAGYGFSEAGRDYNTVDVGTSTLHNIILPPFKAARDAGVRTFMNSFNELNGVPATGNGMLQQTILRGDWKFDGVIVSDWSSIREMIPHGLASDGKHASEIAANAGVDMDMESYLYVDHLKNLVEEGKVSASVIDNATRRVLKLKFELGLFDDPYRYCDSVREKQIVRAPENRKAALDMAEKSLVLLKNDGGLLPLKKSGQTIALIGPLASDKTSPLGNWRPATADGSAVSVLEGMKEYTGNTLRFAEAGPFLLEAPNSAREVRINSTDRSGFPEAIKAARGVDAVVMVLGEHGYQTGEGRSRASIDLPGLQQELLEEVYKVNKNIVLVLMNGRPLVITWAHNNVPAILEAWQPGAEGGRAIARALYGDVNPSGKLPMSFPRSLGQVPVYYNHKTTGRPSMGDPTIVYWSHFSDEANTPLYPFGYGLSYTGFSWSQVKLNDTVLNVGKSIKASVTVTNTGKVSGTETVQLYLRDLVGAATRPVRELKGFRKVTLAPGASETIEFVIDEPMLRYYTPSEKWASEPGAFEVYIGDNAQTTSKAAFVLK